MKQLLFALALGFAFAAPPLASEAFAKKKEKAKEEKKEEKKLVGPQKPGPATKVRPSSEKEVERDALADKKRDEAIEQLKRIIPKVEGAQKADLLFQLAELWFEKSKFVAMQGMGEYDKAYQEFQAKVNAGEKSEEPQIEPFLRKSELYRREAITLYRTILKSYETYARKDEVLFNLAYNLYELGDKKEAVAQYWTLVKQFPQSRFVPDAYVQMGDHFFNTPLNEGGDLSKARTAYQKAADLKLAKSYAYAYYKLAWCDYNAGDYEGAISKFKEVIDYSERQAKEGPGEKDRIQLKREALNDLVVSFVQIDAIDSAIAFYKEKSGRDTARGYVVKLSENYFDAGKYDQSIRTYKYLIGDNPDDPADPEFQQKVVLAYDKLHQRDRVLGEMRRLVEMYGPNSPWAKTNANNKGAINSAYELTEGAMYDLVTDYHQEAIKTKEVKTYRLAEQIYREYLENFPESERAYNMRFYHSEILYALEEWDKAALEYEKVVDLDNSGRYTQVSAYNTILCYEKLVDISKGKAQKTELKENQKIDEKAKKGTVERKQILEVAKKDTEEETVPDVEQKLISSADKYVKVVPDAKDEITVRYKAAFVYYDHHHYVDAAERFGYIILKWPKDQWSQKAADLILHSLNVKEEWVSLNKLSRQFFANRELTPAASDFAKRVASLIEGSQFKVVMEVYEKEKDFPRAAVMFREFVKEFPRSEFADKGLYNAVVIYDQAEQLDWAIEAAEQLIKEYDKSEQYQTTFRMLGGFYERVANFEKASSYYEQYATKYPKDEKAADSLFNAALWQEGMGNSRRAVELYQAYIKSYREKPDVPDVWYTIALIYEREKNWDKAAETFDEYQKQFGKVVKPWKALHARYKWAMARRALDKVTDSRKAMEEIVAKYPSLPDADKKEPLMMDAAAHCRFQLMELDWQDYLKMKMDNVRYFRDDFAKKKNVSEKIIAAYAEIIKYGSPDWAIASLTRIGLAYKNFAKTIGDSPRPKGLDDEQLEMYESELQNRAFPLEEKAVEAFEKALEKSFELNIYNEWTLTAENMLAEFKPDAFGEVKQVPFVGSEFFIRAGLTTPAPPVAAGGAAGAGGGGQ